MNSHLRTKTSVKEISDGERPETKRRHSEIQNGPTLTPHKIPAPVMTNFDHVRENIQTQSRGIYDTPHMRTGTRVEGSSGLPELPPRATFAHMSRSYLDSIHGAYPALHWPIFQHEVDEVYTSRSFRGVSREWIGLFFAVLACGSLSDATGSSQGMAFFDIATQALTPWSYDMTTTHAQAALLLSIFAAESNMRSAGSVWLASAVRVAQELCVNSEADVWPVVESEMRRRLWWAIYVRDRCDILRRGEVSC
jgi:hypothetical protein